jgi:hypothetical protein
MNKEELVADHHLIVEFNNNLGGSIRLFNENYYHLKNTYNFTYEELTGMGYNESNGYTKEIFEKAYGKDNPMIDGYIIEKSGDIIPIKGCGYSNKSPADKYYVENSDGVFLLVDDINKVTNPIIQTEATKEKIPEESKNLINQYIGKNNYEPLQPYIIEIKKAILHGEINLVKQVFDEMLSIENGTIPEELIVLAVNNSKNGKYFQEYFQAHYSSINNYLDERYKRIVESIELDFEKTEKDKSMMLSESIPTINESIPSFVESIPSVNENTEDFRHINYFEDGEDDNLSSFFNKITNVMEFYDVLIDNLSLMIKEHYFSGNGIINEKTIYMCGNFKTIPLLLENKSIYSDNDYSNIFWEKTSKLMKEALLNTIINWEVPISIVEEAIEVENYGNYLKDAFDEIMKDKKYNFQ